jgi:hypothetical protein
MRKFTTTKPSTIEIEFLVPCDYIAANRNGKLYYFRYFDKRFAPVKFNLVDPGEYVLNIDVLSIRILPIEIHPLKFKLPKHQREEIKDFKIIENPNLDTTPARNFFHKGIVEVSPRFFTFPKPIQLFILLHEEGHFYYQNESFADAYAAKKFVELGYNNSTAEYALTKILHMDSKQNQRRAKALFKVLNFEPTKK